MHSCMLCCIVCSKYMMKWVLLSCHCLNHRFTGLNDAILVLACEQFCWHIVNFWQLFCSCNLQFVLALLMYSCSYKRQQCSAGVAFDSNRTIETSIFMRFYKFVAGDKQGFGQLLHLTSLFFTLFVPLYSTETNLLNGGCVHMLQGLL